MPQKIAISRNDNRKLELASFLDQHFIGNLATSHHGDASLATIFFVHDNGALYFKSRTESTHSLNLANNHKAALSVYDHHSTYAAKYGVQLTGQVSRILDPTFMEKVITLYDGKFPGAANKLPPIADLCSADIKSTFYRFDIQRFKIIDEDKDSNRTMLQYEDLQ